MESHGLVTHLVVYKSIKGNTIDSFSQMEESKAPVMTTPKRDRDQEDRTEPRKKGKVATTTIDTYTVFRSKLVDVLGVKNLDVSRQDEAICDMFQELDDHPRFQWPDCVRVEIEEEEGQAEQVRFTNTPFTPFTREENHFQLIVALIRAIGHYQVRYTFPKTQPTPSAVKIPDTDSESGADTPPTQ